MAETLIDTSWIWNPDWNDSPSSTTAGGFVDFRKTFNLQSVPSSPVVIRISADTRYKLWINSQFIHTGPVKGDAQEWFFDELDIRLYLRQGENKISVRVMRLFPGTHHGIVFVRMPVPGFYLVVPPQPGVEQQAVSIATDESWETSIDTSARLPCDIKDDDFLHVYEHIDRSQNCARRWVPAKPYRYMASYGIGPPWRLTPRGIPFHRLQALSIHALHNIKSTATRSEWEAVLLGTAENHRPSLTLTRGTKHHVEIELPSHTTAFLEFIFARPKAPGSHLQVQYSECYEDEPYLIPYLRHKENRTDTTKGLYGPYDIYKFGGPDNESNADNETFSPFHFRTFRILSLELNIAEDADLTFHGLQIHQTNYDLDVQASFALDTNNSQAESIQSLWATSIRTLRNCMHDGYEDCPFYEQLQYAMDTRSSALFTYCVSGDDRLARQAISQLYHSFQPALGLTASRAPSHQLQIIPNFSLYWICMVFDHFRYMGDSKFTLRFLSVIDAIFRSFDQRISQDIGLIRAFVTGDKWEFVDWIPSWKPFGIPPAAQSSGYLSFTNSLYAYTLNYAATHLRQLNQSMRAEEYSSRAERVVQAIRRHCFDGEFFTDGLARDALASRDYSPHTQIWAVLCGAVTGAEASKILKLSLSGSVSSKGPFDKPSVAMSFYTLRALSELGDIYDDLFDAFWEPWRKQLANNVTTWVEDDVSQRSDCHAWGSAPLYEFIAEVAGVTPGEPGFKSITFKPRLSIYPSVKAQIPINGILGQGRVCVGWETEGGCTTVSLEITEKPESLGLKDVTTQVILPNGENYLCSGLGPHRFSVSKAA